MGKGPHHKDVITLLHSPRKHLHDLPPRQPLRQHGPREDQQGVQCIAHTGVIAGGCFGDGQAVYEQGVA